MAIIWRYCAEFIYVQLIIHVSGWTYGQTADVIKDEKSHGIIGPTGGFQETPTAVAKDRLQEITTTGAKDTFPDISTTDAKDRFFNTPTPDPKDIFPDISTTGSKDIFPDTTITGPSDIFPKSPTASPNDRFPHTSTTGHKFRFPDISTANPKDKFADTSNYGYNDHVTGGNDDGYTDQTDGCPISDEGKVLVILYCEAKSTLVKYRKHFHKAKCILRHLETFSERCMNCSSRKKKITKRCRAFKRKLESDYKFNSSSPLRSTRLLLNDEYFVCGSRKTRLRVYNRNNSICCSGKVLESKDHRSCCGDSLMNESSELCCNGNKFPRKSENQACCGTSVYDRSTHFCNSGQLYILEDRGVYSRANAKRIQHAYTREAPLIVSQNHTTNPFVQKYEEMTIRSTQLESKDTLAHDAPSGEGFSKRNVYLIVGLVLLILICGTVGFLVLKNKIKSEGKTTRNNVITAENPSMSSSEERDEGKFQTLTPLTTSTAYDSGLSSANDRSSIIQIERNSSSAVHSGLIDQSNVTEAHVDGINTQSGKISRPRRNSGESLYSTVTLNMSDFKNDILKATDINEHNFVSNLLKEASTQTCVKKETNRRDMFGKAFQVSVSLTKAYPCIQLKNSDARMSVSAKDLLHRDVEVHASSHTSLPEIRVAMRIADDKIIVSPCMEYDFPGIDKFGNHAVIFLKLARTSGEVQVWRRDPTLLTKDGNQCNPIIEVPIVKQHQADLDTFCLLEGDKAIIYTRVFSTFVCTQHMKPCTEREISLEGVLYANMMFSPQPRASLILVVVDSLLLEIEDYKEKLDKDEQKYNMRRIQHGIIPVPESLTGKDVLTVKLSIGQQDVWDFIRDPNNSALEYGTNTFSLHDICCQKRPLGSTRCQWKMETKTGTQPYDFFRCYLYIKTESQQATKPTFTVDEIFPQQHSDLEYVRAERSKSPIYSMQNRPLEPRKELKTWSYVNSNSFN